MMIGGIPLFLGGDAGWRFRSEVSGKPSNSRPAENGISNQNSGLQRLSRCDWRILGASDAHDSALLGGLLGGDHDLGNAVDIRH